MPLLTHEETGSESVARNNRAVALAERPPVPRRPERRGGPSRRLTTGQRVRRVVYWLLGLMILGPVVAFVIGWLIFPVPSSDEVALQQVSRFTFADGSELAVDRPEGVNRRVVRLDQVPQHVRDAVLAAENRDFYSDPGFDITGIARAVYNQLTGGVGGGSTITQQYVKVVTGDDDFSLVRKYKEIVLAVKITREQTKDEILENYLNVIYLGRGAYGIEAASRAYFGAGVEQLTVSQAAMLAGVIQAPSRWDPANDLEGSQRRWTYVLDQMESAGMITPAERAAEVFPEFLAEPPESGGIPGDDRGHIYSQARQEVIDRGIATADEFSTEGLIVTTTVDPVRQRAAVEAATDQLDGQPDNLRSALVSIDPTTGAIQAYYGGPNGQGTNYALAERQPGSSFKPFVLAAALQYSGIGLGTEYDGSSPQDFPGRPGLRNSEGYDCAECSVQTAMTRSINTVFYRIGLDVGPQRVADVAHDLGIPDGLLADPQGGIALGDKEVHPVDMASAFATLAADGVYRQPYLVSRVEAADGRVLYEAAPQEGEQVIPQQVARNVTEAMIDVADFAGIGLSGGRPVAGKTGTVQAEQNGQNKDAWMVGYTPQLATAVWIGTDRSDPIQNASGRAIYGRMFPGEIWKSFMDDALDGQPVVQFSEFEPMGDPPFRENPEAEESGGDQGDQDQGDDGDNGDGGDGNDDGDNDDGNGNDGDGDNGNGNDDDGDNGNGNDDDDDNDFGLFQPGGGGRDGGPDTPADDQDDDE
ncbi:MAG: transglycosylase domain-containing protein [Pseudonocardiales bacterium]|nr:transglycosylase domain-containing protein [Pseudonocardiales bacterium]